MNEEEGKNEGEGKKKMENKNTNKSEKIKDALVKTKTFALNLPFISHLRVFPDRKSKWEKLYDEANEKFADHEKQDELMFDCIASDESKRLSIVSNRENTRVDREVWQHIWQH